MEQSRRQALVLYARLSGMMVLEFAAWGAWSVMIARHIGSLGFTQMQIALVFGTTAFGTIISSPIVGWIADRSMASRRFTAVCHFLGAVMAGQRASDNGCGVVTSVRCGSALAKWLIAATRELAARYERSSVTRQHTVVPSQGGLQWTGNRFLQPWG